MILSMNFVLGAIAVVDILDTFGCNPGPSIGDDPSPTRMKCRAGRANLAAFYNQLGHSYVLCRIHT